MGSATTFLGGRFLTLNTVVRVNQIEVARERNEGKDETAIHTPAAAEAFRAAIAEGWPGAPITWSFSWLALHSDAANYRDIRKLVDAAAANNFAAAREMHLRLFPLFRALFIETNPIGVKTALALLNRDTGEMRLPMCKAATATKLTLRQVLINTGLLAEGQA